MTNEISIEILDLRSLHFLVDHVLYDNTDVGGSQFSCNENFVITMEMFGKQLFYLTYFFHRTTPSATSYDKNHAV